MLMDSVSWLSSNETLLAAAWWEALRRRDLNPPAQVFDLLMQQLRDAMREPRQLRPPIEWQGVVERAGSVEWPKWCSYALALRQAVSAAGATRETAQAVNLIVDEWLSQLAQVQQEANHKLRHQLADRTQTMQLAMSRLEKLERTKSDFISIAAHELKTPLTLVRGYGAILAEDIQGKNRQELVALATGIVQGTERLGRIIDDMIDVASLDSETLDLRREPVHLNKLVEMAVAEVRSHASERDIAILVCELSALPPIEGDSQRLYQVLTQVIGNGVKYTPDSGRIDVSYHILRPPALDADMEFVELIVADTGIGIDPDELEWIFEKFYRIGDPSLHSTSRARFKGAGPGLGLTIARGIVEAHGGLMWVESEGCDEVACPGSQFHIVLPTKLGTELSHLQLSRRSMLHPWNDRTQA